MNNGFILLGIQIHVEKYLSTRPSPLSWQPDWVKLLALQELEKILETQEEKKRLDLILHLLLKVLTRLIFLTLQTWKDLAQVLGLDKYIQLLESRAPHSTRMLLLKWSEKPRWTVHSLLCALKDIGRDDVYNYLRAWLKVPNERTPQLAKCVDASKCLLSAEST